jgi:OmpA-OmpF porin, OOP family
MKKKYAVAVVGLAAAAFALPAAAQMRTPSLSSVYVGGSLGQTKHNVTCVGCTGTDDKDTGFRLFAGYQINRNFAAELGYADLGKAKLTAGAASSEIDATAWDLSAIGAWPIGQFSIFGRLGAYHGERKVSGNALTVSGSESKTGLTFGVGGQYDFNRNLGLRLEWQRYAKMKTAGGAEGDVDNLSLGVLWRFQ